MNTTQKQLLFVLWFELLLCFQVFAAYLHNISRKDDNHASVEGDSVQFDNNQRRLTACFVDRILYSRENGSLATRQLLQRNDRAENDEVAGCDLDPSMRRRIYDKSSRQWIIDDSILDDLLNDIQLIINCTREGDTVVFNTSNRIKPRSTLLLLWNLTLTVKSEDIRESDGNADDESMVWFTCPDRGELFIIKSSACTISNLVVHSCNTTTDVITVNPLCSSARKSDKIRFQHIVFEDHYLTEAGKILKSDASSCSQLEMENVVVGDNYCSGSSCFSLSSNNSLRNITVSRNQATENSSSTSAVFLLAEDSVTTVNKMVSVQNQLRTFQIANGSLDIQSSTFDGNKWNRSGALPESATGGGVIFGDRSVISIHNCVFSKNHAAFGGCIYISRFSDITVSFCRFENNSAMHNGGAVYLTGRSSLLLEDSTLHKNSADHGGGFSMPRSCAAIVSNCSFKSNTADTSGGAIDVYTNSSLSLSLTILERNDAVFGGGIYLHRFCDATISQVNFKRNTAKTGGAVYLFEHSSVFLVSSPLEKNVADYGGGLFLNMTSSVVVNNSNISYCLARFSGGGIFARGRSDLRIYNSSLISNRARNKGGGLGLTEDSKLLCQSCKLIRNRASRGAALHISSNDTRPIVAQFQDSIFNKNIARIHGGGIDFLRLQSRITRCTEPNITCSHIALINTAMVDNSAGFSSAAILATGKDDVRVSCELNETRNQEFLSLEKLRLLPALVPKTSCRSWTGNHIQGSLVEDVIRYYGQYLNVSTHGGGNIVISGSIKTGFMLEYARNGTQFPVLFLTVLDPYGQGPAPTTHKYINVTLEAPNLFPAKSYFATITSGRGNLANSDIVGVPKPGHYSLLINADSPLIEAVNVSVYVLDCRVGQELTMNGEACQDCDEFSYNFNVSKPGGCSSCPENANCRGRYIVPAQGYWHSHPCHHTIRACLSDEACNDETRSEAIATFTEALTDCNINSSTLATYNSVLCRQGYKGPLCGSCDESYGLSLGFRCNKCPDKIISILSLLGFACYLMMVASVTIRGGLPPKQGWQESEVVQSTGLSTGATETMTTEQPCSVVQVTTGNLVLTKENQQQEAPSASTPAPSQGPMPSSQRGLAIIPKQASIASVQQVLDQESGLELIRWKTTEIFKIMLNFAQVTAIAAAINVSWTEEVSLMFRFSEYLGALTMPAVSRPIDCVVSSASAVVRSIWRTVVSLLVLGTVMSLLIAFWGFVTYKTKKDIPYFCKRTILSLLAVTYISYSGLTKLAVKVFYCVNIFDSEDAVSTSQNKLWAMDTMVLCYEKGHISLVVVAVFVLTAVTVCFPFMSAVYLLCNKPQCEYYETWTMETMGILFRAFKEKYQYWESLVMLRKAALSIIVVFSYPLGAQIQVAMACIVLSCFQYLQLVCRPFREEFHELNYYESGSLLVSIVTLSLGQFFETTKTSGPIKHFLAVFIITINSSFLVFLLTVLCQSAVHYLRLELLSSKSEISKESSWWKVLKVYLSNKWSTRVVPSG